MRLSPSYQFLFIVFVTLGVYYPTLFAPFNSLDDKVFVAQLFDQLLNEDGISWARHFSPGGTYDYYRPLLSLSFEIDKYVGGLQEMFMHFINILIHLLNVVLVWLIARRIATTLDQPKDWLPLLAALLFALHPINTEAVNWIAGRTDLLAGSFVFISFYALIQFMERRSLFWGGVSAFAILGGALSKETALFFLPAACFLLFYKTGSFLSWKQRWLLPAFYAVAVSAYFFLRWGAFETDRGLGHTAKLVSQAVGVPVTTSVDVPATVVDPFPWFDAASTALKAGGFYLVKLLHPLPLNFAIHKVDDIYILPGIVLILSLLFIMIRRNLTSWLFLVSASIATSALVVLFTTLAWSPIAERYMYIPCAPFIMGVIYTVGPRVRLMSLRKISIFFTFLLLVWSAWGTASRNVVWQDNLTLYQDAVRQSPDFAPAKNQLALALATHNRTDEAYEIVAGNEMSNNDAGAMNKAVVLMGLGDYEAARYDLEQRLLGQDAYRETQILEQLVKITKGYLKNIDDRDVKFELYEDMLEWHQRIKDLSPTAFNYYRIGRIELLLEDKVAAQKAFAEAAKRFPEDSIYKKPALKLATELAQ